MIIIPIIHETMKFLSNLFFSMMFPSTMDSITRLLCSLELPLHLNKNGAPHCLGEMVHEPTIPSIWGFPLFFYSPKRTRIFFIGTPVPGWWLGHPSEKYESIGMIRIPIDGRINHPPATINGPNFPKLYCITSG